MKYGGGVIGIADALGAVVRGAKAADGFEKRSCEDPHVMTVRVAPYFTRR